MKHPKRKQGRRKGKESRFSNKNKKDVYEKNTYTVDQPSSSKDCEIFAKDVNVAVAIDIEPSTPLLSDKRSNSSVGGGATFLSFTLSCIKSITVSYMLEII